MFNKDEQVTVKDVETIVGSSVKIKGDLHGKGNIVVEGEVEGSLFSENKLFIKDKAKVSANIEAKDAVMGGVINGHIKIKGYLEITSTAIINGDIIATQMSIEKGAIVNGNILMKNDTNKILPTQEKS